MLFKLFSILSLLISPIFSWGPQGHIAVANVAQTLITSKTFNTISTIIPNGNMSSVANWADEVRTLPQWKWSAPLHFINTPDWNCSYIRERDCYNNVNKFMYCVDGAIQNYTDYSLVGPFSQDYIKFLIHFVGDIHQPLHCGFKGDLGGNNIKVKFNNKYTELHAVWDSGIIEERVNTDFNGDYNAWNNFIIQNTSPFNETCTEIDGVCSQIWGNESVKYACDFSYVMEDGITKIQSGDFLDYGYYKKNIDIVEQRISKAGIRLANLLNFIYK